MYIIEEIMTYWCIDNLKKGAIPAARLYHTKYRELSPPGKHVDTIFTPAFLHFDSKRRYFRNEKPEHAYIIRA